MITEQEILSIIRDRFLDGDASFPLTAETRLLEEGIVDSLGLVRLAGQIEQRVPGLKIDDQDISQETFGSVHAILRLLAAKTSGA